MLNEQYVLKTKLEQPVCAKNKTKTTRMSCYVDYES